MAQKKAVSAKKKSARPEIKLKVDIERLPASRAKIASLKKALKNQVLTWVASDAPGETPPVIVCEEFHRPPKGSNI
jgi:hypothetical protein